MSRSTRSRRRPARATTHRLQVHRVTRTRHGVSVTFGCSCRQYTDHTAAATERAARAQAGMCVDTHRLMSTGVDAATAQLIRSFA